MFNWFGKPKKSEEEEYLDELARRSRAATEAAAQAAAQYSAQSAAQCDTEDEMPVTSRIEAEAFRMEIADVFTITGRGTIVTGRVESGRVCDGDTVYITGRGGRLEAVVKGIEMFRKVCYAAETGDAIGLLLRDLKREDVCRGDMITGR